MNDYNDNELFFYPREGETVYYVKVILGSRNPDGKCVWTLQWRFPRIVLAEVVTHRRHQHELGVLETLLYDTTTTDAMSKNSASSRAIPMKTMIADIRADPFRPERWSKNAAGMSEAEYLEGADAEYANSLWGEAIRANLEVAEKMMALGVHKQDANRLLEPFAWTTQVVTATEWDNFWALRCDHRAHPAFRVLARMSYLAITESVPQKLEWGQWHLPYVRPWEAGAFSEADLLKLSTARVAWTSYASPDKTEDPQKAFSTYEKLVSGSPKHASPMEAQAQAQPASYFRDHPDRVSNLVGWLQHRKLLPEENVACYTPPPGAAEEWRQHADRNGYPIFPYSP